MKTYELLDGGADLYAASGKYVVYRRADAFYMAEIKMP
jgi:hypothetical protein